MGAEGAEMEDRIHIDEVHDSNAFRPVRDAEEVRIAERRAAARGEKNPVPVPDNDSDVLVGLALSGGGIRSAAFNLGILQVLERWGYLKQFDYLSTVSGGGYIGSSMTWFASVLKHRFPLVWGSDEKPSERQEYRERVRMMREAGSYLIPGDGLNVWSLVAAALTGTLSTLLVIVPFLFVIIAVLSLNDDLFFFLARKFGLGLIVVFVLFALVIGVFFGLSLFRSRSNQQRYRRWCGRLLAAGVALIVIGTVPLVIGLIKDGWELVTSLGITVGGIATTVTGLFKSKPGDEVKLGRSLLLTLGVSLIAYGVFIAIHYVWGELLGKYQGDAVVGLLIALGVSFLIAVFGNINNLSMHRYYRNRLMDAFLQDKTPTGEPIAGAQPDACQLWKIPQTAYPYHIINATHQTVGSTNKRLRLRGGDNFIFTPLYCGSEAGRYVCTYRYIDGKTNLATAMAISGAAADTNTYATRSIPLTFLMTLINARLGYWILNPRYSDAKWINRMRPTWYCYLMKDILGQGLTESSRFIHLSDGGHFENLGLYELVKRGCSHIVVCDAGCDPNFNFADIGRAIERVRADFAVSIDMPLDELIPDNDKGYSETPYVIGRIKYGKQADGKKKTGLLIYIKSTITKDSLKSPEVNSYKRKNRAFPDESTSDQVFDEQQFEAYRELGYRIAETVFRKHPTAPDNDLKEKDLIKRFSLLETYWEGRRFRTLAVSSEGGQNSS